MKKIIFIFTILIVVPIIIYFGIYLIQGQTIKKSFVNYNEGVGNDTFIRCNYNIFNPEFAYTFNLNLISEDGYEFNKKMISFHKPKHLFSQTNEEWESSYTGGTTIQNTTFPELVEMVKEDCSQFRKGHGDYYGEDLAWSYSPYEPEPEKSQEDIEFEQRMDEWSTKEYNRKIESGEIVKQSLEEELREKGIPEEAIKKALKDLGREYIGL